MDFTIFRISTNMAAILQHPKTIFKMLIFYVSVNVAQSQVPPRIQPFVFPQEVMINDVISITCTATAGDEPLSFQWLKDDREVSSPNAQVGIHGQFSSLLISKVQIENAGNYTCIIKNNIGKDSYTAALSVIAPPKWIKEPEDTEISFESDVTIHCSAIGIPKAKIEWNKLKDGNVEAIANDKRWQIQANGSLLIKNVMKADEGTYSCLASNNVGEPLAKTVTFRVRVPARFEEKFSSVTVRRGESARLRCEASGDQPLTITWKKGTVTLKKTGNARQEIFETLKDKGVTSELVIRTSERADSALYTCLAENGYGKDERNVKLLVLEVPAAPLHVKTDDVWSRSASISWTAPFSGNSPITNYIIQYWRHSGAPHRLHEEVVPTSQMSALIRELSPGSQYAVSVVAENEVGRGQASEAVTFVTGEEEPSAAPLDITVTAKGPSTLLVTWRAPPEEDWNGQLLGYYVGFKAQSSAQTYSYNSAEFSPMRQQEVLLTNLLKATEYSVIIKAYNKAGSGPASQEVVVKTSDGDVPSKPRLYVISTSPSSIGLKWHHDASGDQDIRYLLHFRDDKGSWQDVSVTPTKDSSYVLSDLESGRVYQVYLTAANKFGSGDPSDILSVMTDGDGEFSLSAQGVRKKQEWYLDSAVVITVVVSVITILSAVLVACFCMRRVQRQRNLEQALAQERQYTYAGTTGTTQRYVDMEKARPLVAPEPELPNHYPSPYATMVVRDEYATVEGKEMKTFMQQQQQQQPNMQNRPLPVPGQQQKPGSLKKRKDDFAVYDTVQ